MKKEIELHGTIVLCEQDFHNEIKKLLSFPDWYCNNLDDLWDCLNNHIDTNLTIHWLNSAHSKRAMGYDFERVFETLKSAEAQNSNFKVLLA